MSIVYNIQIQIGNGKDMDLIFYIILAFAFIIFSITCLFTNIWLGVCNPRRIFKFSRSSNYNPATDQHRRYQHLRGDFKDTENRNCLNSRAHFSNNFCQECRVEIPEQTSISNNCDQNSNCQCQEQQLESVNSSNVQESCGDQGTFVKKKQNNHSSFFVIQ